MKNQKGFTLIEMILTFTILGFAIPPILNAFASMQQQNTDQHPLLIATYLAEEQLERAVMGKTFSQVSAQAVTTFIDPFDTYQYQITVSYVNQNAPDIPVDPTVTDFKRVQIIVTNTTIPTLNIQLTTLVPNI